MDQGAAPTSSASALGPGVPLTQQPSLPTATRPANPPGAAVTCARTDDAAISSIAAIAARDTPAPPRQRIQGFILSFLRGQRMGSTGTDAGAKSSFSQSARS